MNDALFIALLAAGSGAAAAAVIGAISNSMSSRRSTREMARSALWEYQRAVAAVASKYLERAGYGQDQVAFNEGDITEVRKAVAQAYPWAAYLSQEARRSLVRQAAIEIGEPPWDKSDERAGLSASRLAEDLEAELDRVFPLTWRNAVRNWVRPRRKTAR